MEKNIFNELAEAIINSFTYFINAFSGLLQIAVYLTIGIIFFYALIKCGQAIRLLARFNFAGLDEKGILFDSVDDGAPLAVVAASFFCKTKKHYLLEKKNDPHSSRAVPPDGFIRDAAFQYSARYFEEKFLEPISLSSNLMPSLGFIGTIIGMVVHFLSNTGSLNSDITVIGIATALYTTFAGLVCYTILEFMLKVLTSLGRRRIDEGLAAVAGMRPVAERKAV